VGETNPVESEASYGLSRYPDLLYADYMDITDAYLGEIIEEVVEKYYDEIDLSTEYGELLEYISMELVKGIFGDTPLPERYERTLRRLSSRKYRSLIFNIISYLVSRYLESREMD